MTKKTYAKTVLALIALLSLSACGTTGERLKRVGKDPEMSSVENPVERAGYRPVSMPMPAQRAEVQQANSLWLSGRKSFFKDQRATQVGDILTVMVDIQDNARLENKTEKTKDSDQGMGAGNLLGFESHLNKVLPEAVDTGNLVGVESNLSNTGKGKIERTERVTLKVAAVVTQVLPNGNMVIHGKQQVRVSNERRDLEVAGIIRPEDITTQNTIGYEKMAEARIAYGGAGMLTDANRPRYGSKVLDIILPF